MREAQKLGPQKVLECRIMEAASRKRKAVLGLIEEHLASGHKGVVFTGRRLDCESMGQDVAKLVKAVGGKSWAAHGDLPFARRQDIVDEFMAAPAGEPAVFVGTGDAFGESLNLHDADFVVFVMLPYTPGQIAQWEGRFTRLGQKRPVIIYYVIAERTVDEHVAQLVIDKMDAIEIIAQDAQLAAAAAVIGGIEDETAVKASIIAMFDDIED